MLITFRYAKPHAIRLFAQLFETLDYYGNQIWLGIRTPFVINLPHFLPRR